MKFLSSFRSLVKDISGDETLVMERKSLERLENCQGRVRIKGGRPYHTGRSPVDGSNGMESTYLQNEGQLRRPAFYFVAIAVGRLNAWVEARRQNEKRTLDLW
jgi:hypothetical protein